MTALREHLDQQGAYLCHSCPSDNGCTRCLHEGWDTLGDRLQGGKTGWPPGMLQDDYRPLSRWFASKPDARRHAREAAQQACTGGSCKQGRRQCETPEVCRVAERAEERADAGAYFLAVVILAVLSAVIYMHLWRL